MNLLIIVVLALVVIYFLYNSEPPKEGVSAFKHKLPKQRYTDLVEELGEPYFVVNKPGGLALWTNLGFYQEIILRDESIKHTKPKPHCDFLYSTVKVYISEDVIDSIEDISESITYDRLKKELTARCHFMGANVATLQLAMEITINPGLVDNLKNEYESRIFASMKKENYNRMKKSLEMMVRNNQTTYHNIFPDINCK